MKLVIFDLDDTLYDKSGQIGEDLSKADFIIPFPEALEILKMSGFVKILVSYAKHGESFAQKKLDTLGIRSYFDKIFFCEQREEKKILFEQVIAEYKVKPQETLVVGDRIDNEIRYGNILGCVTVLFKHGKYASLFPVDDWEKPKYTINSLRELIPILASSNTFK